MDGAGPALLVLRALGLGDLLTSLPALRALARAFPDHRRVLATTPPVIPLALHAGVVHEAVAAQPLQPLVGCPAHSDVAVNLHGRGPESHRLLDATRPRRLIAFASGRFTGPEWRTEEHEVHRWCRMLTESGIPADPGDLDLPAPDVPAPPAAAGATVVHPGAASPARRWPPERWAAVARAEARAGRRVLVTGGPAEVSLAHQVAARACLATSAVWAGSGTVMELAAVVASADRLVCGDTGAAHLATALGTPSVVLFGPVPPALWGPPPDRPRHVALWAGRTGDPHGATVDAGLLEIGVDDVLRALSSLPRRHADGFAVSARV